MESSLEERHFLSVSANEDGASLVTNRHGTLSQDDNTGVEKLGSNQLIYTEAVSFDRNYLANNRRRRSWGRVYEGQSATCRCQTKCRIQIHVVLPTLEISVSSTFVISP